MTWNDCKAQTDGFSGAEYKSFMTRDQAVAYVEGEAAVEIETKTQNGIPVTDEKNAVAYVDGSYNVSTKRFGYGIVLFTDAFNADGTPQEIRMSKAFSHEELAEMRNVAGEIMGAAQAMKTAKALGLKELTIYHDYEGIAKWCTGEWKAKKKWTQKYKAFYEEMSRQLKISFVKVEAHSGDVYNDMADQLAKEAVGNN